MAFVLGLLVLILDVWAIMNILGSGAPVLAKLLWSLLVFLAPIVGFVIWYAFGPR